MTVCGLRHKTASEQNSAAVEGAPTAFDAKAVKEEANAGEEAQDSKDVTFIKSSAPVPAEPTEGASSGSDQTEDENADRGDVLFF